MKILLAALLSSVGDFGGQLQLEAGLTNSNFFIIKKSWTEKIIQGSRGSQTQTFSLWKNREQRKLFKDYLWSVYERPIDKGAEDTDLKKKNLKKLSQVLTTLLM